MAYVRKPNYHFKNKLETGIDKVPNGRVVVVEDYDGQVKTFVKENNTGLTFTSTIVGAQSASNIKDMSNSDNMLSLGAGSNIDTQAADVYTKTVTSALTLTMNNFLPSPNVNSGILELTNGGAFPITYPVGSDFAGGTPFVLTASGKDVLGFYSYDAGVTITWILLAKDSK